MYAIVTNVVTPPTTSAYATRVTRDVGPAAR